MKFHVMDVTLLIYFPLTTGQFDSWRREKQRVFKLKHLLLDILKKLPQTRRRAKNTFLRKSQFLSNMPRCTESVHDYLLTRVKLI